MRIPNRRLTTPTIIRSSGLKLMRYEAARCLECGSDFDRPARGNATGYCSNRCRMRAYNRANPRQEPPKILTCQWCGSEWKTKHMRSPLCRDCRAIPWRRNMAYSQGEKRIGAKSSDAGFSRLDIFVRDAWTCGICGDPIDRELEHPHPMSASLDHIVPLPRGAHSRENVRASHLACNVARGERRRGLELPRDEFGQFRAAA